MVAAAVVGTGLASAVLTSSAQSDAADTAANAQMNSTNAGIAQQNKQFTAVQQLLSPYVNAGTGALGGQQTLLGLNGAGAQQSAIDALQASPAFQSQLQLGNTAILQNASATGGLRGGNTQAALAQFSPQLLAQTIQNQYANLGGMTSLGQNAAAGVGNAGMQTGNQITSLLGQQGASMAGNALAQGNAQAGLYSGIGSSVGAYAGLQNQQALLQAITNGQTVPGTSGFTYGQNYQGTLGGGADGFYTNPVAGA